MTWEVEENEAQHLGLSACHHKFVMLFGDTCVPWQEFIKVDKAITIAVLLIDSLDATLKSDRREEHNDCHWLTLIRSFVSSFTCAKSRGFDLGWKAIQRSWRTISNESFAEKRRSHNGKGLNTTEYTSRCTQHYKRAQTHVRMDTFSSAYVFTRPQTYRKTSCDLSERHDLVLI